MEAMEVSVHEAKTHLSRLLERVEGGDEVIIARNGAPVAKLVRFGPAKPVLGSARGTAVLKPGWADPLTSEELANLLSE